MADLRRGRPDQNGGRFLYGRSRTLSAKGRRILARVRWSVRVAGYKSPRIRWAWPESLWYEPKDGEAYEIGGVTSFSTSSCSIAINMGHPGATRFADIALHELAHALTSTLEGDHHPHAHSDVWGAVYARLYRAYFDTIDAGPAYIGDGQMVRE